MKKLTTKRLGALLLALVMVIGLGTAVFATPINMPQGPFNLTVHHLVDPTGAVVEGLPNDQAPQLVAGGGLVPVTGTSWQITRINVPADWNAFMASFNTAVAALENAATPAAAATAHAALTTLIDGLQPASPGNHQADMLTNAQGAAAFMNIPAGVYIVRQLPNAAADVTQIHVPFLVSVPIHHQTQVGDDTAIPPTYDEFAWISDVHVFPKQAQPDLGASKGVSPGSAGDMIQWYIEFSLQPGLGGLNRIPGVYAVGGGTNYTFIRIDDRLSNYLRQGDTDRTAIAASVWIEYLDDNGDWQVLPRQVGANINYVVGTVPTPAPQNDPWPSANTLRIDILLAGRNHLAANADLTESDNIRVHLTTQTMANVPAGTEIPNVASITYGPNEPNGPPPVEEQVFSLQILKVNPSGNPLAGATFRLYDQNNIIESPAGSGNWIPRPAGPGNVPPGGTALTTVTTGNDGLAPLINGLQAGRYVLVETETPTGYLLLPYPIVIWIDENTANDTGNLDDTLQISVLNSPDFELPLTGGAGTLLFTIVGLALIGGSVVLLVAMRKRSK